MNKKISTGAGIAVVVAVVAGAIGLLVWSSQVSQPQPAAQNLPTVAQDSLKGQAGNQTAAQNASQTQTSNGAQANANDVVYKNTQYGFQIKMPKEWAGYKVVVLKRDNVYVYVDLPTTDKSWPVSSSDPKGYTSIAAITIWDINKWNKELKSPDCKDPVPGCPMSNEVLAKTSKYVFDIGSPQDLPADFPGENADQFVPTVKSGFSLIK